MRTISKDSIKTCFGAPAITVADRPYTMLTGDISFPLSAAEVRNWAGHLDTKREGFTLNPNKLSGKSCTIVPATLGGGDCFKLA